MVVKFWWNHIQLAKFGTNASGIRWSWSWRDNSSYDKESVPWVRCASGNVYIVYFHSALTFLEGWVKIYNVEMVKF